MFDAKLQPPIEKQIAISYGEFIILFYGELADWKLS